MGFSNQQWGFQNPICRLVISSMACWNIHPQGSEISQLAMFDGTGWSSKQSTYSPLVGAWATPLKNDGVRQLG